jgi:hypothetical protein
MANRRQKNGRWLIAIKEHLQVLLLRKITNPLIVPQTLLIKNLAVKNLAVKNLIAHIITIVRKAMKQSAGKARSSLKVPPKTKGVVKTRLKKRVRIHPLQSKLSQSLLQ